MTRTMRYGIDVSEWQKEIDWPKAAASGVEFAMIRATHGQKQDACFERNIRGALAAGVDVGVYCCSYAADAAGVRAEAAIFLQTILPFRVEITYPAAFDAEQPRQFALGKERVTQLMLTFCEAVTAAGYIPLVYTNCNWLNSVVDKPALADAGIDLWVAWPRPAAGFADLPEDGVTKHPHTMWQFSTNGQIRGIEGSVDLDVCYTDYAAGLFPEEEPEPAENGAFLSLDELGRLLNEMGCEGILL